MLLGRRWARHRLALITPVTHSRRSVRVRGAEPIAGPQRCPERRPRFRHTGCTSEAPSRPSLERATAGSHARQDTPCQQHSDMSARRCVSAIAGHPPVAVGGRPAQSENEAVGAARTSRGRRRGKYGLGAHGKHRPPSSASGRGSLRPCTQQLASHVQRRSVVPRARRRAPSPVCWKGVSGRVFCVAQRGCTSRSREAKGGSLERQDAIGAAISRRLRSALCSVCVAMMDHGRAEGSWTDGCGRAAESTHRVVRTEDTDSGQPMRASSRRN